MKHTTYWNNNGKHQQAADAIFRLIPDDGPVTNPAKNKALEKFRKASNVYYDIYNNGLRNRTRQFKILGINAMFEVEQAMDTIVAEAYREQQLNLPADSQSLINFD